MFLIATGGRFATDIRAQESEIPEIASVIKALKSISKATVKPKASKPASTLRIAPPVTLQAKAGRKQSANLMKQSHPRRIPHRHNPPAPSHNLDDAHESKLQPRVQPEKIKNLIFLQEPTRR